jgi:hypothetical protein
VYLVCVSFIFYLNIVLISPQATVAADELPDLAELEAKVQEVIVLSYLHPLSTHFLLPFFKFRIRVSLPLVHCRHSFMPSCTYTTMHTQAPTNYDAHAALVHALRLHMEFDRLKKARQEMQSRFPLQPAIWTTWIEVSKAHHKDGALACTRIYTHTCTHAHARTHIHTHTHTHTHTRTH